MPRLSGKQGLFLFGALAFIVLACCLLAYIVTGDKGIEERFAQAVGFDAGEEEEEGGGLFGFNIEGNLIAYAIILVALVAACVLLYRKFGL